MKALTLLLLMLVPYALTAQGVFTNQTHTALQKVINDYPNHFKNIRGQLIDENPQTIDYGSTVQIPGSVKTVITRYTSDDDKEIYSWKCLMLESEDFAVARGKYKELFKQITNSIIKLDGNKPFILNGTYEDPTEEKRFTSSPFTLVPASGDLKKLRVELTLEFLVTEWRLSVLVYDQVEGDLAMDSSTE